MNEGQSDGDGERNSESEIKVDNKAKLHFVSILSSLFEIR